MPTQALIVSAPGEARSWLLDALRARGFDALAVDDGEAALAIISSSDVTMVIVTLGDDGDPDSTRGLALLRTLRSRADTAMATIVAVALRRRPHLAEAALEAGADDYLVSSAGQDELVARVVAQVRARRRPTHAIAGEVQARADAIASIESLIGAVTTPLESTLAAACRIALGLRGVIGAGVLALDEPDTARVIVTAGRAPLAIESGDVFDPGTAASLWQRATSGPWFQPSLHEPGWLAIAPISDGGVVAVFGLWFTPTAVADDDQRAVALATAMDLAAAVRPLVAPILRGRTGAARRRLDVDDVLQTTAFTPVFQPILDISRSSGRTEVVGYEALTRFHDATPPDRRFAAASYVGRREALELAAVQAAVAHAHKLPTDGWLSLNLSASTIVGHRETLAQHFATTDRPIVIEITEHEPISDYPSLRAAMASIEQRPAVCVDDAGSGYASLQHVAALEPEYIKLDRTWVRGLSKDRVRQAIVAGMREFATRAGVELIAEGVEQESELDTLRTLGIRMAQGYLLGRPSPVR